MKSYFPDSDVGTGHAQGQHLFNQVKREATDKGVQMSVEGLKIKQYEADFTFNMKTC